MYKYHISFRISHPSRDLTEVSQMIQTIEGIKLGRIWKVGEPKKTPKGKPLPGVYKESYCYFYFDKELQSALLNHDFPEAIEVFVEKLLPFKSTLLDISESGGELEFFCGWSFESVIGITFNQGLIQKLAEPRIELGLQIYPSDESSKKHYQQKDELEEKIWDIAQSCEVSAIVDFFQPKYDPYPNLFAGDLAMLIKEKAGKDVIASEMKGCLESMNEWHSDKLVLPKSDEGYHIFATKLSELKWEE